MKSDIRVCANWQTAHRRPLYTLDDRCPECDGPTANSAPAPFSPEDPYGEHRRRARRRDPTDDPDAPTTRGASVDE